MYVNVENRARNAAAPGPVPPARPAALNVSGSSGEVPTPITAKPITAPSGLGLSRASA